MIEHVGGGKLALTADRRARRGGMGAISPSKVPRHSRKRQRDLLSDLLSAFFPTLKHRIAGLTYLFRLGK